MDTSLKNLIQAAESLSPSEQIELISAVSHSLQNKYLNSEHNPFWQSKSLEQLAQEQHIQPISSLNTLASSTLWPENESIEDFLLFLSQERRHSLSGSP